MINTIGCEGVNVDEQLQFAHITNPVGGSANGGFSDIQRISQESLRRARKYVRDICNVELYAIGFEEDQPVMPESCTVLPPLVRSVLDLDDFAVRRKLPLIRDILGSVIEASRAPYIIYTNADIAVVPHFYESVAGLIEQGVDSCVVNRRCIPEHYSKVSELPLMYAECGNPHPGYDCFVMHRDSIRLDWLGKACIGVPGFDSMLVATLCQSARNFKVFDDFHLTFHIGDDRSNWKDPMVEEYWYHNEKEGERLRRRLVEEGVDLRGELPELAGIFF